MAVKAASPPRRRALAKKPAGSLARLNGPAAAPKSALRAVVPLRERKLAFGNKWEYAPAPEDYKFIPVAPRHELFINGRFVAPRSGKWFDSINPATEEKLTEVGKQIAKAVAGTSKKLTLELGGKAANIVFEDAPIDQAVEGIISGIFFNQGHVCCAGSRLFVQEGVYAAVLKKLRDRMRTLRLGNPLDKNTDIGAINSRQQLNKIRALVQSGIEEGAFVDYADCSLPERGFWFPPTLLTNVTMSHRVAREEIFGPVLSVLTFRTPEEAFERANNTPYGLSAGVWTDKGSKIFTLVNKLRAGVVWANTYNKFDPASPFGGYKESGFGREGGVQGLWPYLRLE